MYVAYYDKVTPENHRKAMQLADLFNALLSHPEQIYQILRTTEDEIEWDYWKNRTARRQFRTVLFDFFTEPIEREEQKS